MRRTLTIIATIVILGGIGVAVYFYFFTGGASITVVPAGSVSLPSAGQGPFTQGTKSQSDATVINTPSKVTARLVKISSGPIVPGMAIVDVPAKNASSSPDVVTYYIERQSGNVFSYSARTGLISRINNKTIPGIQSATWIPNASMALVRYLSGDNFSTINTYALPSTSSSSTSSGFFLSQNLADVSVSQNNILTLASGVNGSVASIENINGAAVRQLFSTPLTSLRLLFAGNKRYLAYTKPSYSIPGYAFIINELGNFVKIAGPLNGLSALSSPSGKFVLVSYVSSGSMQMILIDVTTKNVIPLPISTITDKCVWASNNATVFCGVPMNPDKEASCPDDWYQGIVQFSDRIWKIDVSGRFAQLVLDFPSETKELLDAEALNTNQLGTYLIFTNKNNGSLWSYQL